MHRLLRPEETTNGAQRRSWSGLAALVVVAALGCTDGDRSAVDAGRGDGGGGVDDAGGDAAGDAAPDELEVVEGMAESTDGVRVWYRAIGGTGADSETLLLMHGGPGFSSGYLVGLEQLASPRLRVVRLNQRGVAASSTPDNDDYGMERILEDVDAVLSALGTGRFHFLGHSWGGLVAMRYAIRSPERLDSLVLVSSLPPTASPSLGAALDARVVELQDRGLISKTLPNPVTDPCGDFAAILPAYFGDPELVPPPELANNPCDNEAAQLTRNQTLATGWSLTDQLAAIDVRALVLMGELDFLSGQERPTAEAFDPDAALEIIPGAGHFPWNEAPEATLGALHEFLHGT